MEEVLEDQSHYEISLTAGQAFVAFVLLLLSLAASFAFGLMIGRGQMDDRFVSKKVPATQAVSIAPVKKPDAAVKDEDFKAPAATIEPAAAPAVERPKAPAPTPSSTEPAFAQLLSTSDQKTAEGMAAKLIERGFSAAYVERTSTDKGQIFRVRIKFPTEGEARAAEPKLKEFSKDVWITR
jgi:cell division septation protein DedD